MRLFLCLLSSLLLTSLSAQRTVTGRVVDATNDPPIAFATVSAPGESGGAYTNDDGSFTLPLAGDSLVITSLGYQVLRTPVGTNAAIYQLQPRAYLTEEVVVTQPKKLRKEKFGNSKHSFSAYSGWWGTVVVRHVGKEFTENGLLRKAVFRLDMDGNKCEVFARVRVLTNDNGRPGTDLINETVLVRIRGGKNKYEVDLEGYKIDFPPGGLFVGVEFMRPAEVCANVDVDDKRFYVMVNKSTEPLTFLQRNYGKGSWSSFTMLRKKIVHNARFSVEIGY